MVFLVNCSLECYDCRLCGNVDTNTKKTTCSADLNVCIKEGNCN